VGQRASRDIAHIEKVAMPLVRAIAGLVCTGLQLLVGTYCCNAATFATGVLTGTIQNSSVTEASGIVASRKNADVLWTHNDSGDTARVFAMTPAGTNLGTYTISGAGSTDWEDIAIGPGPVAGTQYLYFGDIGDNGASRSSVSVYRVPEPTVSSAQSPVSTSISGAAKLTFQYPDGPRDAESLFVDPLTNDIYIISKPNSPKRLYRAAYPQSTSGTTTLQLMTTFNYSSAMTAADISPSGNEIIVRSYATTSGRMYVRPPGGSIADAFNLPPISIPLLSETQGEAIGFDRFGWGYYTTSEGSDAPIAFFKRQPQGDFNFNGTVDAADYVVWRDTPSGQLPGNYNTWRSHFGQTATGVGSSVAVPEPAAAVLFLTAIWLAFAPLVAGRSR
jgi:hypothetical protein